MDLGQIFENNFDCYADTHKDGKEGEVVLAMTKEKFIEVTTKFKKLMVFRSLKYFKIGPFRIIIGRTQDIYKERIEVIIKQS